MADAQMSIPVKYLFNMTVEIPPRPFTQEVPQGTLAIVPVLGGRFEGPKVKGTIEPPGGGWLMTRGDGTCRLDVRLTLKTQDSALIVVTCTGVGLLKGGGISFRSAALFGTGDPRYAWMNRVQAVGVGAQTGDARIVYDIYALV